MGTTWQGAVLHCANQASGWLLLAALSGSQGIFVHAALLPAQPAVELEVCINPDGHGACGIHHPPFRLSVENMDTAETVFCQPDLSNLRFLCKRLKPGRYRFLAVNSQKLMIDDQPCPGQAANVERDVSSNWTWIAACETLEIGLVEASQTVEVDLLTLQEDSPLDRFFSLIFSVSPDRLTRARIRFDQPSVAVRQNASFTDTCTVGDLPRVDERDLSNLLSASPHAAPVESAQGEAVSVSGQRTWFVHYDADGADYTNSFFGSPLGGRISMNTESIQEFTVIPPGGAYLSEGFGPASVNINRLQNLGFDGISRSVTKSTAKNLQKQVTQGLVERWYHLVQPAIPFSLSKTESNSGIVPFGGGGNKNCRIEPCPYMFAEYLFGKSDIGSQKPLRDEATNNFPIGEAVDLSKKSHEVFFRKTFLSAVPEQPSGMQSFPGRITTAFQFALLGNPAAEALAGRDSDPPRDELFFHTTAWSRSFAHAENRAWYAISSEQRTTLDGVFDNELSLFLPRFGGETIDRYIGLQLAETLTLIGNKRLIQLGADWVYAQNRRRSLDEEIPVRSRVSNQSLALFLQGRFQIAPQLALTLGLRWEGQKFAHPLMPPQGAAYGSLLNDPAFPSDGTLPSQWKQWQPRVSFAWSDEKGRLTFRAGLARYFARQTMLTQLAALEGTGRDPIAVVQQDPADVVVFSRDYRNPLIDAANLALEWRPHHGTVLTMDFRYSKGKRLTRFYDINLSDPLEPIDGQANPNYRLPEDGNRVDYTLPSPFPDLGEVLLVDSSARSLYRGVTISLKKFLGGGWLNHWQINAYYTYSLDKDDDSSENHLSSRPFNRFDFSKDWASSDRDIRHRVDLFATGRIRNTGDLWLMPDFVTLRYQHRTPQPASFDPLNQKSFGVPCGPFNSATRVVDFIDCGRNHLRLDNTFSSFDWGFRWRTKSFPLFNRLGPIDEFDSLVVSFEMLNSFNSRNIRRRQDLLQVPFLLDDRRLARGIRVSFVLHLNGFGLRSKVK